MLGLKNIHKKYKDRLVIDNIKLSSTLAKV